MERSPHVVATIAALRALTNHHQHDVALVVVSSNEEWYYFDSSLTTDDDGVLIVKPTDIGASAAGRWKLVE